MAFFELWAFVGEAQANGNERFTLGGTNLLQRLLLLGCFVGADWI